MRKKELLKENEKLKGKLLNLIKEYDVLHCNLQSVIQECSKRENKIDNLEMQLLLKTNLCIKAKMNEQKITIKKIVPNEKKKAITVWFNDETMQVVKCAKGVKYDLYSGVAYAIIKQLYENNSQFKKVVNKAVKNI